MKLITDRQEREIWRLLDQKDKLLTLTWEKQKEWYRSMIKLQYLGRDRNLLLLLLDSS